MIEIKAPHTVLVEGPRVFLAGSIDMGSAVDWQTEVVKHLQQEDVIILNPRRDDWDSSWVQDISNPQFNEQVNWELNNIEGADLVLFYFAPGSLSPVTLLELGLVLGLGYIEVRVCCPRGYWRRGNVEITCAMYGVDIYESLEDMLNDF